MLGSVTEYGQQTRGKCGGAWPARSRQACRGGADDSAIDNASFTFCADFFRVQLLRDRPQNKRACALYQPPLIHMFREGYRDVLAIPITISNDGARRGTVLSFDLQVTHLENQEIHEVPKTCISAVRRRVTSNCSIRLPFRGRSSYSGVVLFHALQTGAFTETTGGVELPLELKLSMNVDRSGDWYDAITQTRARPLTFVMKANFIQGFRAMESGRPDPAARRTLARFKGQSSVASAICCDTSTGADTCQEFFS